MLFTSLSVLHSEPMDTGTDGDDDNSQLPPSSGGVGGGSRDESHHSSSSPHGTTNGSGGLGGVSGGGMVVDGIKLPPAPSGKKCSQHLQVGPLLLMEVSVPVRDILGACPC